MRDRLDPSPHTALAPLMDQDPHDAMDSVPDSVDEASPADAPDVPAFDDFRRPSRTQQPRPRPGRIAGAVHKITVETREGVALVLGRMATDEKQGILGLYKFGGRVHDIWKAAQDDDPYADWYLWQIHELMETEKQKLHAEEETIDNLLASQRGVSFGDAHSVEPVELDLSFKTPFGFQGAILVADYDNLVRKTLTAQFVGLLSRRQAMEEVIYARGRRLRHLFQLPTHWKYTGVNRDDMRLETQMAATAIERMGDLPKEFLNGTQRAPNAPRIRTRRVQEDGLAEDGEMKGDRGREVA